jgi:hypothetical protein
MKIRLSPGLSYIIGLCGYSKSEKGIGVRGSDELVEAFITSCLDMKMTEPKKILYAENEAFFYNSAMQKFFRQVWEERPERFKYGNDYAAAYLAGLFDAVGGVAEGRVALKKIDVVDKTLLSNLRMLPSERRGMVLIGKEKAFLRFISPYVKVNKGILQKAGIP